MSADEAQENPEEDENYLDYLERLIDFLGDGDLWLSPEDDYTLKKYFFEASKYAYNADRHNRSEQAKKEKETAQALLKFYPSPEILGLN